MEIPLILLIILGVTSGLTEGDGVLPDGPLNAAVGQTVMFNTTLTPPDKPYSSVGWRFGATNIISINGETTIIAPGYEGRVEVFASNGSLELRNLALNDTGDYTVTIFINGFTGGTTRLDVYVPASDPKATVSSTDLVEFNSSVRLSCSASGSSVSFLWLNGSSEVTGSDRVQLTDGGANLTITNVTRYDQGPFRCRVFNPVSEVTTDPINLSISYGPEKVQITGPDEIGLGQTITLTCSAESRPSADYTWTLNGTKIHNSPVYTKNNSESSDSGNYTCHARNNITGRTSSAVRRLSVKERTPDSGGSGLSAGAIAGTVIACVVVVVVAGFIGAFYIYKKKDPPRLGNRKHKETPYENSSQLY